MKKQFTVSLVLMCLLPVIAMGQSYTDKTDEQVRYLNRAFSNVYTTFGDDIDNLVAGNMDNIVLDPSGTFTAEGVEYTWPAADGGAGEVLSTNGSATLAWIAAGAATAWDDIGDPDGAGSITFSTYTSEMTGASTAADQWTYNNTAAFGDISLFLIEQKTGNPTDGTLFELKLAAGETDPDYCSFSIGGVEKFNVDDAGNIVTAGGITATGAGSFGSFTTDAINASTPGGTLALNGNGAGGVSLNVTGTGNVTVGDDMVVSDTYDVTVGEGSLTVDNDQNEDAFLITSDATTSGSALKITANITTDNVIEATADDLGTGGAMVHLDSDNIATDNFFLECYDGATNLFTVSEYGATVIDGNAATDVFTVTAGDIQVTNGDADIDVGIITVDWNTDEASSFIRNYNGAGTDPAVTIKEDHTASTNVALLVENDGTGNSTGLQISHDGDLPTVDIDAGAARTGDVIDVLMTNQLAERALYVHGAGTSATGEGMIELHSTGNIADGGAILRIDNDTGTPAGTTNAFCLYVDDDSLVQAGAFAVEINSNANDALKISAGNVDIDTQVTSATVIVETLLNVDEEVDVDFNANDEFFNITSDTTTDYAAGSGIFTMYDDAAGQDNASYMIRAAREANGDAEDHFLLFEDDSTGAAGDGTDMFYVNSGGVVYAAGAGTFDGDVTVNGDLLGDGSTDARGFTHVIQDLGAGPYTVTAAMSGNVFYNSEAVTVNLPADPTGLEYTFVVGNASNMHLTPDLADVFVYIGCAAGDRLLSATVGDTIRVVGLDTGSWYIASVTAGDGDFTDTIFTDAN